MSYGQQQSRVIRAATRVRVSCTLPYPRQLPAAAQVDLAMTAQPARPLGPDDGRAGGLGEVQHVIAVSSCKGGAAHGLAGSLCAVST